MKNNKTKTNLKPYSTAGPARTDPAAHTCASERQRGPALGVAHAGSRLGSATDDGAPRDREIDKGGRKDGGVACRRWHLWRVQRCYGVRLIHAHLTVPSIEAIVAAKGGGDGHGSARPQHGRLRRDDGVTALMGDPTSFRSVHRT